MFAIETKNVSIQVNDQGIIESIRCKNSKDDIFYCAKAYPYVEFFREVREIAFKEMLEHDKEKFKEMLIEIKNDKESHDYGVYLLENGN